MNTTGLKVPKSFFTHILKTKEIYSGLFLVLLFCLGYYRPAFCDTPVASTDDTVYESTADSLSQTSEQHFEGEYGLWIQREKKKLIIHWITSEEDSGYCTITSNRGDTFNFKTAVARAHQIELKKYRGKSLALNYGSLQNKKDRHSTAIRLHASKRKSSKKDIDSIYAIGDIHGEFDRVFTLLQKSGFVDASGNWIGGSRYLIIMGDMMDRGADATRVLWMLYGLELQAEEQGGTVEVLLGNHEIMVFLSQEKYLSEKERLLAKMHNTTYGTMYHPQHSLLGAWLAHKRIVLQIGRILFSHAGIAPPFHQLSVQGLNSKISGLIQGKDFTKLLTDSVFSSPKDSIEHIQKKFFFYGAPCPFWFRGYAFSDTMTAEWKNLYSHLKIDQQIVGHTPMKTMSRRCGGKVLAIDCKQHASEMLLLVRQKDESYDPFRITLDGTREPL